MKYLRKRLSSDRIIQRLFYTFIVFLTTFFIIVIISYYFLPAKLLKSKNPLQDWENSSNTLILSMQIFFYNFLSVIVIVLGSLFGEKKIAEENYLSIGYSAFFTLISINAVVLGTWSFSVESQPVALWDRLIGTFNITHRAGLWEMIGQLFITCATAHISVVLTSGKDTITRSLKNIHLSSAEIVTILLGLCFMIIGAIIESFSITSL